MSTETIRPGCRQPGRTTRLFQRAKELADNGHRVVVIMKTPRHVAEWRNLVSPEIMLETAVFLNRHDIRVPDADEVVLHSTYTVLFDHALLDFMQRFRRLSQEAQQGRDFLSEYEHSEMTLEKEKLISRM